MKIIEIAHLRNLVAKKNYSHSEKELISNIEKEILKHKNRLANIALESILNCKTDLSNNDYESAARELHLIHNFPLKDSELNNWDEYYFYKFELLGYIETVKKTERIKKLILNLSKIIK
jgi:hypothetical protein